MRELNVVEIDEVAGGNPAVLIGAVAGGIWGGVQYGMGDGAFSWGGLAIGVGSGVVGGAVAGMGGLSFAFYGGGMAALGGAVGSRLNAPRPF